MRISGEIFNIWLTLTLYGMGAAFSALVLIYLFNLLVARVQRFYQTRQEEEKGKEIAGPFRELPAHLVAVVSIAIERYLEEEQFSSTRYLRLESRRASAWKAQRRKED